MKSFNLHAIIKIIFLFFIFFTHYQKEFNSFMLLEIFCNIFFKKLMKLLFELWIL